jgi:hypothetical protein
MTLKVLVFINRTSLLDPKNFSVSRYSAQRLEKELGKSETVTY